MCSCDFLFFVIVFVLMDKIMLRGTLIIFLPPHLEISARKAQDFDHSKQ